MRRLVADANDELKNSLNELIKFRRSQFHQDSQIEQVPLVVYGNIPPHPSNTTDVFQTKYYKVLPLVTVKPKAESK